MADHAHGRLPAQASDKAREAVAKKRPMRGQKGGTNPFKGLGSKR